MNIEQAINYLKSTGMSDEQIRTVVDAFTCEDAISRQAVLEVIKNYASMLWKKYYEPFPESTVMEIIQALPSVTPGTSLDLEGLKSDMKALNCGYPYGLDYLLDCLDKRLGITITDANAESEDK